MSTDRSGGAGAGGRMLHVAGSEESSSSDTNGSVTPAAHGVTAAATAVATAADDTIRDANKTADDSGSLYTVEERLDTLENFIASQTHYFKDFVKTTDCIKNLSGHVALLSRALCLMETRYGVPANKSMGQYLYKKLESAIPPEMRQAAEDAGFSFTDDAGEKPLMYSTSAKRQATSPTSPSAAKAVKVVQYEPTVFVLDGITYKSKEQPCIKTEGNLRLSTIEGRPGYMLHLLSGDNKVDLGGNLDMVNKQMLKGWPQNPTEQQYVDRIAIYVQHIIKVCTGKVKMPIVICGELNDDTLPGDTLKLFIDRQGEPLLYMIKHAAASTGLHKKDKGFILSVLRKVVIRLKLAQKNWATGSGRMEVEKPSLPESSSCLDMAVFEEDE